MKIICVEEHIADAAIDKATQAALAAQSGYMVPWGSESEDKTNALDHTRPYLLSMKAAKDLVEDVSVGRIAAMDKHGIDMQVLSYTGSVQMAPAAQALDLARAANDRLAGIVTANPKRFGGFATLPWQRPEAAATELERAVKELGLVGALIQGRPGETFLDDERYEPVLAKLSELKVPLYVHPGFPLLQVQQPYYGGLHQQVTARLSLFGWGWHNEAGVQVIRMILSGRFEKFPNLQVISGHWGEMVPFYLQRLDDSLPEDTTRLSCSIADTYKKHVYVTPSGMAYLPHFEFIHKVLGADRILYSVDYPYLSLTGAREYLERLPISVEDREKIAHGNAEALFHL